MKNVHVFVLVFLCAVTMLIFQIKRIISSEKWCNYVVTFFKKHAKNLGRSDDGKRRKKKDGLTLFCAWQNLLIHCYNQYQNHRNHTFHWKGKCEKPNISCFDGRWVLTQNIQQNEGIFKLSVTKHMKMSAKTTHSYTLLAWNA